MEPNLRDTPLRRFNTFWWGAALFVAFALAALVVKNFTASDVADVETENGKVRTERFNKISAEQSADINTYKKNADGTVQVKPADVFGLGKEIGLLSGPRASAAKHNKQFN